MANMEALDMNTPTAAEDLTAASLLDHFHRVRSKTASLAAGLSAEDQMVQSCAEASPAKWHLAHTTWFFETFILSKYLPDYRPFHPDFAWLFNSYYKSLGGHPDKRLRASFSRPPLGEVLAYRGHVEEQMARLLTSHASGEVCEFVELGLHHEQQHQELILTDIKHAFWSNPLQPAYSDADLSFRQLQRVPRTGAWCEYDGGMVEMGHNGDGFAFDNELCRHKVFLNSFRLASHPVTCREYLTFMRDRGYERPELWLSDGWDTVQAHGWHAPLYWQPDGSDEWKVFTLRGTLPLSDVLDTPACHISYYEADAFARWAGCRLPSEFEWEHAAASMPVSGNFLESGALHPEAAQPACNGAQARPVQMFGDVWEWTQSAYTAYPKYKAAAGALGEYNGKFMCNQLVLRGGSAVTPASHMRASYRNFFPPGTRWQFSGIRLAAEGASV